MELNWDTQRNAAMIRQEIWNDLYQKFHNGDTGVMEDVIDWDFESEGVEAVREYFEEYFEDESDEDVNLICGAILPDLIEIQNKAEEGVSVDEFDIWEYI